MLCTQLMGAGVGAGVGAHESWGSQGAERSRPPQPVPPCAAAVVVVRVCFFVPPGPHALLQSPHSLQSLCAQLTGPGVGAGVGAHEAVLHSAESERPPHAVPPCAAYVVVVCVRVSKLGPHALLQSP